MDKISNHDNATASAPGKGQNIISLISSLLSSLGRLAIVIYAVSKGYEVKITSDSGSEKLTITPKSIH